MVNSVLFNHFPTASFSCFLIFVIKNFTIYYSPFPWLPLFWGLLCRKSSKVVVEEIFHNPLLRTFGAITFYIQNHLDFRKVVWWVCHRSCLSVWTQHSIINQFKSGFAIRWVQIRPVIAAWWVKEKLFSAFQIWNWNKRLETESNYSQH